MGHPVIKPVCFGRRVFLLRESHEAVTDALSGVGMSLGAGGGGHRTQALRAGEQAGERVEQLAGNVEVRLFEQQGRAGLDHLLGVAALVVVGGGGKGNQQGGLGGGGQLGHRGSAAAGHHQCRLGKMPRHIVDKRLHIPTLRVRAAGGVGCLGRLEVARAALMEDGEARNGVKQLGENFGQMEIEDARALRAAEDEQVRRRGGGRRREGEELRADGNAGDLGVAEPLGRRFEVDGGGLDALADEAIGEAGYRVRLKGHRGNPEAQGRGHRRAGGVAAHAEDDVGLEVADQLVARPHAEGQAEQGAQAGKPGDVLELADIDQFQLEAGFGNQARLHAARRADKEDLGRVAGDQLARHGQRRNDVASGTAAGDEYTQLGQIASFQASKPNVLMLHLS